MLGRVFWLAEGVFVGSVPTPVSADCVATLVAPLKCSATVSGSLP